jgi:3-hydroxyacyl-[acyl-carrier protein] dehydratase/trans-2-decenoyl-[acyl-carrier protein] isomerase
MRDQPACDVDPTKKKNSYGYEDLLECAHGRLFGPGNARLPLPPLLMLDRIVRITDKGGKYGKGELIAEQDIKPDLWFFKYHFESDPIMPGALGLDAMWQLLGFFLGWTGASGAGRALGVGEVRFVGQILPTVKKLVYHLDVRRVVARQVVLGIADGTVTADGQLTYEAKDMRVGLFAAPKPE